MVKGDKGRIVGGILLGDSAWTCLGQSESTEARELVMCGCVVSP